MSAKANWHTEDLVSDDDFDLSEVEVRPNGDGNGHHRDALVHPTPVDYWRASEFNLDTPIPELEARLDELIAREGRGAEAGITCPWKDLPDMTCSACPLHEIGQDTRKSALCRLGREQERVAALLIARRHGPPRG